MQCVTYFAYISTTKKSSYRCFTSKKSIFNHFFLIQEHSLHLGKPIHDLGEPKNHTENLKKNEKKTKLLKLKSTISDKVKGKEHLS
jgi:hypothetical protein